MWIIVVVLFFAWVLFSPNNSEVAKVIEGKLYHSCGYYGGFDDVSVKEEYLVYSIFNEDNINMVFSKKGFIKHNKIIKYSDIIKVKLMSEINITKEVSLGKMICFGWVGLAMKNEKKHIKEYVVVETKYENESIFIILEESYKKNERLLKEIKDKVEKARENNMDIESV